MAIPPSRDTSIGGRGLQRPGAASTFAPRDKMGRLQSLQRSLERGGVPRPVAWRYNEGLATTEECAMAVGRYVTDLDQGDVLGPLDYTMSKFVVREYCHANELHQDVLPEPT